MSDPISEFGTNPISALGQYVRARNVPTGSGMDPETEAQVRATLARALTDLGVAQTNLSKDVFEGYTTSQTALVQARVNLIAAIAEDNKARAAGEQALAYKLANLNNMMDNFSTFVLGEMPPAAAADMNTQLEPIYAQAAQDMAALGRDDDPLDVLTRPDGAIAAATNAAAGQLGAIQGLERVPYIRNATEDITNNFLETYADYEVAKQQAERGPGQVPLSEGEIEFIRRMAKDQHRTSVSQQVQGNLNRTVGLGPDGEEAYDNKKEAYGAEVQEYIRLNQQSLGLMSNTENVRRAQQTLGALENTLQGGVEGYAAELANIPEPPALGVAQDTLLSQLARLESSDAMTAAVGVFKENTDAATTPGTFQALKQSLGFETDEDAARYLSRNPGLYQEMVATIKADPDIVDLGDYTAMRGALQSLSQQPRVVRRATSQMGPIIEAQQRAQGAANLNFDSSVDSVREEGAPSVVEDLPEDFSFKSSVDSVQEKAPGSDDDISPAPRDIPKEADAQRREKIMHIGDNLRVMLAKILREGGADDGLSGENPPVRPGQARREDRRKDRSLKDGPTRDEVLRVLDEGDDFLQDVR